MSWSYLIQNPPPKAQKGIVYLVGAGPGDPDLITLRGIDCLKQAEVVIYDRLANPSLLAHARHAELIDVGKQPNRHPVPQEEINRLLVEKTQAGKVVVRLKGGDPCVFGRGGEEAQALVEAGLDFEIVPGVTSAIAGPSYAGIPVTHRNLAFSVAFVTGHRADFSDGTGSEWAGLASGIDTLVFLMGMANLPRIVEQLVANGRLPDTPVALVQQATRTRQKTVVGTLANIVERSTGIRPPALIIVGEVVRLRESLRWFDRPDRHPLLGLRVLNTRPLGQAAELSRRLAALGAESVELPTTQIAPVADSGPLDAAIRRLVQPDQAEPRYHWLLFTSTNSVSFFLDRLLALGYDVRTLAGVRLAAVGRATVDTLRSYGLRADTSPTRTTSVAIAGEMARGGAGQYVLAPHSDAELPDFVEVLRGQGIQVEAVAAYSIQPASPDPIGMNALLKGGVDVATFISPSGLSGLAAMLSGRSLAEALAPLTVLCIGPTTAEAAQAAGVRVDLVAEEHTIDGLIKTLQQWYTTEKRQALEALSLAEE